ncbi:MAG TPA: hypothetical protein H9684_03345 [Firmicutes bacterium]|nr:hypothetical protein [Bacillota bacterium]
MEFSNANFRIVMNTETRPPLHRFDIVHNPENINTEDFYMARVLEIKARHGGVLTVALLDTLCSNSEHCAVLEPHHITIILFSSILRLDLDTGRIAQFVKCDNMGGLFEIHPIEGGYIIWGEGDIFRYDLQLNRIWHFMGRDILVSRAKDKPFRIDDGLIHCCDFEGWHYVLDLNGKLMDDFREADDRQNRQI